MSPPRRCTAQTSTGRPCRAWAVRDANPPLCAAHGGGRQPIGAPQGNRNAETHGAYSSPLEGGHPKGGEGGVDLDERIADLDRRIIRLGQFIDGCTIGDPEATDGTITVADYIRLVALYGQLCSRLGRLMRDREQLAGGEPEELQQAINEALDSIRTELGVDL